MIKWFRVARWISLPQSMLPALTALAMTFQSENFSWWLGITGVIGVWFLHLGMNMFDDYFDYKFKGSDYRNRMAAKGIKARIAKCSYLVEEGGTITLKQVFRVAILFCFISLICGAVIFYFRGLSVLYIALVAGFLGLEYSAPPLRLSYHGLADIVIGFIFGPLVMMGIYVSACGDFSLQTLFISVPVGLLVANILFTDSMLEYRADKSVDKKNLAVLIGSQKVNLFIDALFNFLPLVIITCGVVWAGFSYWYLLVWIIVYMPIALFYRMVWFVKNPERKFERKKWMGPFQNWNDIIKNNLDWYMVRWFLARNYVTFFCLIIIILNFVI
ncbi:MAG: prenyltransferase [Bacteroidales bacterium]|jgi:1,4-dihydroxy-2-naphthoate octaprenyltransferase|nr:prenyltransferase [Bacteroidales bacterium]